MSFPAWPSSPGALSQYSSPHLLIGAAKSPSITELIKALSYSRAAVVMDLLRVSPGMVREMIQRIGMSQPQSSQVLSFLRRSGLVRRVHVPEPLRGRTSFNEWLLAGSPNGSHHSRSSSSYRADGACIGGC